MRKKSEKTSPRAFHKPAPKDRAVPTTRPVCGKARVPTVRWMLSTVQAAAMNPALVLLLAVLLCVVSGAVGYLLGRSHASRRVAMGRVVRASAPAGLADTPGRLRREIDCQVQQLRRARDNAEPRRAPAADRMLTPVPMPQPPSRHFFADTVIEEDKPR